MTSTNEPPVVLFGFRAEASGEVVPAIKDEEE